MVAERSNERVADDLVAATRAMCLRGIQSQLSPCSCADRNVRVQIGKGEIDELSVFSESHFDSNKSWRNRHIWERTPPVNDPRRDKLKI